MRTAAKTNYHLQRKHGHNKFYSNSESIKKIFEKIDMQLTAIDLGEKVGFRAGHTRPGNITLNENKKYPVVGIIPAILPQNMGSTEFRKRYCLKYNYAIGEMANGITSIEMVYQAAKEGFLGMFGTGGLTIDEVEDTINSLKNKCKNASFGMNLLCNPLNPEHEYQMVKRYLKNDIRIISASAYTNITVNMIYYKLKGLKQNADGTIQNNNKVIAKISRAETASRFLSPPPMKMIKELLEKKLITEDEARLSEKIPVADDIVVEGNSGGHTDNGVVVCQYIEIDKIAKELSIKYKYINPIHLGIAGGIGTPEALASAFVLGADFVMTGSINQACVEAGTSPIVREMLASASVADVVMAPSSDSFETGAKVQILKKGTLYHARAKKMHDLYLKYDQVEEIGERDKKVLENILDCTIEEAWKGTVGYFAERAPRQLERANSDKKHKLALLLRSYLGRSSKFAISGNMDHKNDFQIWCGPSMGAFNSWVKGTCLEKLENRYVSDIAYNLLWGGAYMIRINIARSQCNKLDLTLNKFEPKSNGELGYVKSLYR